ncbi:hypothetical protein B0J12DRAFT_11511 [Macrophomina phaseolina]|uniref:Transmembrane protein n=1 Tax=Macrophomina phaseolina TaxID=35725 RepID=A0ABQ8GU34_9PEZI|nr:hypothetical protein B0J12DRAFT_11511 [Macrophomina phaseolina]
MGREEEMREGMCSLALFWRDEGQSGRVIRRSKQAYRHHTTAQEKPFAIISVIIIVNIIVFFFFFNLILGGPQRHHSRVHSRVPCHVPNELCASHTVPDTRGCCALRYVSKGKDEKSQTSQERGGNEEKNMLVKICIRSRFQWQLSNDQLKNQSSEEIESERDRRETQIANRQIADIKTARLKEEFSS